MKTPAFRTVLVAALVWSFVVSTNAAKTSTIQRRSRASGAETQRKAAAERGERVDRSVSFIVQNVNAGEVQFPLRETVPARRRRARVPRHGFVTPPEGPFVPDTFRSPEVMMRPLR